jgi:hypothetical protein
MSPRDVAVGEEFIASILDTTQTVQLPTGFPGISIPFTRNVPFQDRALVIDGVGARLELMFGDAASGYKMTEAERQFALTGVGGDPVTLSKADRRLRRGTPERAQKVKEMWDQRLAGRREQELDSLRTVYNFDDNEIDIIQQMFDEANTELADSRHALHSTGMTHVQKQFELMKDKAKGLRTSGVPIGETIGAKLESTFTGMEKARDGQYYITEALVQDIRKGFQDELNRVQSSIRSSGTVPDISQTQTVTELRKQIDHLDDTLKQVKKGGDVIARVNIGIGQFKGEAMVLSNKRAARFRDPITGLIPYVIGDTSAVKREVGTNFARNIMIQAGESSTEVFSDPLMALYHGEYFNQPAMISSMRQNAEYGLSRTEQFMQSADIPEDVLKSLQKDVELAKDVMLDPQTRMSHLRKAREAEEIMAQMASGIRANQIPAMVRRVSDYYSSQVVRLKNGRVDVVMPTASRFSLRTFDSKLVLAEGFDESTQTAVDLAHYGISGADKDSLKTVGFRINEHTLMMSGNAAYLYQHALGGFDLDDKGIPMMSTFKDSNGDDRLAFLALRQPTSFQESLAMTADLSDYKTVSALFENNDKFRAALEDNTTLASLGISRTDKNYIQLREMINGGRVEKSDVNQRGIEDLILKITNSDHVYPDGLPELTNSQVFQMVVAQSPSILGLDKMVRDATGKLSPWGKYVQEIGLDPNEVPVGYDSDAIFQVLKKASDVSYNDRVISEVSSALGYNVTNFEHLQDILGGGGTGFRAGDDVKAKQIMIRIAEDIMLKSVNSDPAESIGLFVNRQGAAVSVLETSKKILLEETALGVTKNSRAYDKFIGMSSVMTLPASEAVDVAKQIGAEQVLHNFGAAIEMAGKAGVTEDTIQQALKAYIETLKSPDFSPLAGGIDFTDTTALDGMIPSQLGSFGQGSLRAFSSVGYIRGRQIAEQVARTGSIDVNELYGLQEVMFEGGFARVKGQDRITVKSELIRGLGAAMGEEVEPGVLALNPAQMMALHKHRAELSAQDTETALQSMTMQVGTAGYDRYAELDQMVRGIMDIQSAATSISRKAMADARNLARNLDPVARAQYQDATENIIGTVSTQLQSLQGKVQNLMLKRRLAKSSKHKNIKNNNTK